MFAYTWSAGRDVRSATSRDRRTVKSTGPCLLTMRTRTSTSRRRRPTARSTTSRPSHARAQADEKLVQLLECLAHRIRCPGAGGVESFLRGIEFVQDQQRLATFFLEGHRGDGTVITFVISPDEARVRYHFDVPTEEHHRL